MRLAELEIKKFTPNFYYVNVVHTNPCTLSRTYYTMGALYHVPDRWVMHIYHWELEDGPITGPVISLELPTYEDAARMVREILTGLLSEQGVTLV